MPGDRSCLCPREVDVNCSVVNGLNNAEITDRLYLSRRTAQDHVANAMYRTQTRSRTQLAVVALRPREPMPSAARREHVRRPQKVRVERPGVLDSVAAVGPRVTAPPATPMSRAPIELRAVSHDARFCGVVLACRVLSARDRT